MFEVFLTKDEDVSDLTNTKDPTQLAYLGVQQLLASRIPENDIVGWLKTAGRSRHHSTKSFVNGVQGQFINLLWGDLQLMKA
ncbi:hypothetical protein PGTUg99_014148 [Puccinia graminis f. sp. tritici]|uniref:Uncharacterized protein n=1 Tax=Puccinia graminis f. sp. tritici TaxID=56615 RepID=A0A5B0QSH3_PUCGR|nr:hypothetical protein PGTUg99_014148 [Puccinia graminis f. sp. tritici]